MNNNSLSSTNYGYYQKSDGTVYFCHCDFNVGVIMQQLSEWIEMLKWRNVGPTLRVEAEECVPRKKLNEQSEIEIERNDTNTRKETNKNKNENQVPGFEVNEDSRCEGDECTIPIEQ